MYVFIFLKLGISKIVFKNSFHLIVSVAYYYFHKYFHCVTFMMNIHLNLKETQTVKFFKFASIGCKSLPSLTKIYGLRILRITLYDPLEYISPTSNFDGFRAKERGLTYGIFYGIYR